MVRSRKLRNKALAPGQVCDSREISSPEGHTDGHFIVWWDEVYDEHCFILMYLMYYNLGPWRGLDDTA